MEKSNVTSFPKGKVTKEKTTITNSLSPRERPEPESTPDDPEPELKEKRYELRSALKNYGESRAGGGRQRQGRF